MRKRELLVAGLIACGTTALIVDFTLRPGHERARFHYAVTEVRAIESAAMLYIEAHPGECPTLRDLKDAKIVDETRPTTDPWNTELRVVCDGGRAKATSAGPDKQFDTEDDIGVPGATKSR